MSSLGNFFDIHPSSISRYYLEITSDFAKDKPKNNGPGIYQNIAEEGRFNQNAIWDTVNLDEKNVQKWEVFTILSNPQKNKLIAISPWTASESIIDNLNTNISSENRNAVKEVVTDMSFSMEKIARETFPQAYITTDRFHVMKNILEDLLAVRTRIKTKVKATDLQKAKVAKQDGKKYHPFRYWNWETEVEIITRVAYQLKKRKKDRSWNQRLRRKIIQNIEAFDIVVQAYNYVHSVREIYDLQTSKQHATALFIERIVRWEKEWRNISEINNMRKMIENRLDSITNYFRHRSTNGFAEGLNSRIQRLVSNARWFKNINYTIYRIIKLFW